MSTAWAIIPTEQYGNPLHRGQDLDIEMKGKHNVRSGAKPDELIPEKLVYHVLVRRLF